MSDRWTGYGAPAPRVAPGWRFDPVNEPSRLWGANGIALDATGATLMVTQVFGAQVTAIDTTTGAHRAFSPQGQGMQGPDDGVFGADGTFFATEPMFATVSARAPDGTVRTLADDLPAANGITMDATRRRLFVDEFRPEGRLLELDPAGERPARVLLDGLAMPNAFAMGPDGALWFPQVLAGEVWRYDLDTAKAACAFDGFSVCCAVKFAPDGRLLVAESGSGTLTAVDTRTGRREALARVERGIDNLAVAADGRLYVSHFTTGAVAEVTGGVHRTLAAPGLIGPYGLCRRADGTLVAADGLAVSAVAPGGPTVLLSLLADLPTLAVGVAEVGGALAVAGLRGQLFVWDGAGPPRAVLGHLDGPSSLAPAGDGAVLVVERGAGRVLRLAPDGSVTEVARGLDRPHSVAVAPDGTLWVTEHGALTALDAGEVRLRLLLDRPHGVAVAGSGSGGWHVYVADPGRRRVLRVAPRMGTVDVVVEDAPLGPAVPGATVPHASSPLWADADGAVLVGCDGDGTVRRLCAPGAA